LKETDEFKRKGIKIPVKRKYLVLDSKYRTNKEDTSGYEYKFKLNRNVKINGNIKLENFIFQNSQYTFSVENKSNKFIFNNIPITLNGTFSDIDSFIRVFNDTMQMHNIQIIFSKHLYEIKVQSKTGSLFSFNEYYDGGNFMQLLGFDQINEGYTFYTNKHIPRLFSQS
jgi:hypothetical protein